MRWQGAIASQSRVFYSFCWSDSDDRHPGARLATTLELDGRTHSEWTFTESKVHP